MVSGRRSHAAALWHSGSAMPGHPRSFRAALSGDTRASRPSRNAALRSRRSLSQALGPCHRLPACRTRNVRRFPSISARRRKSTPRNTHSIAYSPRNCKREWRRGKTRKNDRIRISLQNRRKTSRKGIRRKGPSPYIFPIYFPIYFYSTAVHSTLSTNTLHVGWIRSASSPGRMSKSSPALGVKTPPKSYHE